MVDLGSGKPDGARTLRIEKMKAELKKIHREAIEDARQQPVPAVVLAYQNVYGSLPHGWPPGSSTGKVGDVEASGRRKWASAYGRS